MIAARQIVVVRVHRIDEHRDACSAASPHFSVNVPMKMSAATSSTNGTCTPARAASARISRTSGFGRIVSGNPENASIATSSSVCRACACVSSPRAQRRERGDPRQLVEPHLVSRFNKSSDRRRRNAA
jgi:hypothetical protein